MKSNKFYFANFNYFDGFNFVQGRSSAFVSTNKRDLLRQVRTTCYNHRMAGSTANFYVRDSDGVYIYYGQFDVMGHVSYLVYNGH